jgi:hypothetical protein
MSDIERGERRVAAVALISAFLLRVVYAFRYRVDTDEPQHLHVAWGWAHGFVQYRDVFDNHMPLFHLLTAPLVRLVGERADIVPVMRLAMLPLYGLMLWCTYRLGRRLFSARAGLWAAVLVAWLAPFFRCSLEFRADDLWAPLWLLGVVIAVEGELSPARALAAGLVVGAAVGVSMKTSLLIATLVTAAAVAAAFRPERPGMRWLTALGMRALLFTLGVAVVPAALAAGFAALGAWDSFVYGTIRHNLVPAIGTWRRGPVHLLLFPAILGLGVSAASILARRTPNAALARRRVVVLLGAVAYSGALAGLWPLITREDYLPFYPILAVAAAALAIGPLPGRRFAWVPAALLVLEVVNQITGSPPWTNRAAEQKSFLADVLRLTRPEDSVFDMKGETIFRPRAFFWGLEYITKVRLERGLIADSIPEMLVAHETHVATLDCGQLPPRGRRFLAEHYVPVGSLRVAGQRVRCVPDRPTRFIIGVPGVYRVVEDRSAPTPADAGAGAPSAGALDTSRVEVDDEEVGSGRFLSAGSHELRASACSAPLVVVWAPAVERGFLPVATSGEEVAWHRP